jgi:hypothetical protein
MSNWMFEDKIITQDDIPEGALGFVYKITNVDNGKFYYGKKMLTKAATKMVNGKKKKLRKTSDWEEYWSSSPYLQSEIERLGKDMFKREILMFCSTKASLSYSEEHILFVTGALFNENCYNGNIRAKIMRSWFNKTPELFKELCMLKL